MRVIFALSFFVITFFFVRTLFPIMFLVGISIRFLCLSSLLARVHLYIIYSTSIHARVIVAFFFDVYGRRSRSLSRRCVLAPCLRSTRQKNGASFFPFFVEALVGACVLAAPENICLTFFLRDAARTQRLLRRSLSYCPLGYGQSAKHLVFQVLRSTACIPSMCLVPIVFCLMCPLLGGLFLFLVELHRRMLRPERAAAHSPGQRPGIHGFILTCAL